MVEVQAVVASARARLIEVMHREMCAAFDRALLSVKEIPLPSTLGSPASLEGAHEEEGDMPQEDAPHRAGMSSTRHAPPDSSQEGLPPVGDVTAIWPEGVTEAVAQEEEQEEQRPAASLQVQVAGEAPAEQGVEAFSDDEVFKGTVRLNVEANGGIRQVVQFVDDLCQRPEFRLLRLVGNHHRAGVDIWLGLREPVCLKRMLMQMKGVEQVVSPLGTGPNGHERFLNVWLAPEPQGE